MTDPAPPAESVEEDVALVREALDTWLPDPSEPGDWTERTFAFAALDAIASALEARHKREWEYHELWHSETDRAEAAEAELERVRAERDALVRERSENLSIVMDDERDRLQARLDRAVEAQ